MPGQRHRRAAAAPRSDEAARTAGGYRVRDPDFGPVIHLGSGTAAAAIDPPCSAAAQPVSLRELIRRAVLHSPDLLQDGSAEATALSIC
jgi:hypothetical protein